MARLMAADFAEHVLFFFENNNPGDGRPAKAIEMARKFSLGEISKEELAAAWAARAAWDAGREWQRQRFLKYLEGKHE